MACSAGGRQPPSGRLGEVVDEHVWGGGLRSSDSCDPHNPGGNHNTASTAATNPSCGSPISLTRSAITPIRLSARATLSSTRLHTVRLPSRADFCSPGELSILMVAMTTPVAWEVARRVEVAGVGVRLPARKLTPDRLRTALRDAINPDPERRASPPRSQQQAAQ